MMNALHRLSAFRAEIITMGLMGVEGSLKDRHIYDASFKLITMVLESLNSTENELSKSI
jgi:hypothetical protein